MKRKTRFQKVFLFALSVVLVLSLVAGCGGDNPASPDASDDKSTVTSSTISGGDVKTETDQSKDSDKDDDGEASKTEVIIATPAEPTGFFCQDTAIATAMNRDAPVIYNVYAFLAWMDESGEIVPWLATSWEKADDGLSYIYNLRDDVFFHNGEKMTAEDVAFSFNLCIAENQPLTTNLLINIKEAVVVDEYTVRLELTAPFDGFPSVVTSRAAAIINKKYYEEVGSEGYLEKPIGCGPYMFESRISGQEITLQAFPDYYAGKPSIDTVRIRPVPNISTAFISLRSGDIDVVHLADMASCLQLSENDAATYMTVSSTARAYLTMNCRPSHTSILSTDLNLRKAIQYAINKNDLVLGAVSGAGQPIDMSAPYFFNGAPDEGSFYAVPWEGDLDKAKEFLDKSNYNGQSLKLVVNAGTAEDMAAQIIQGQLMEIGINVEIAAVDSGTYNSSDIAGEFDMNIGATVGSLGDVSTLNTFYAVQENTGPKYDDWEELEELCFAANESSGQERKDLMAQIGEIVNQNAYDVALFVKDAVIAYNKDLNGMMMNTNGTWRVEQWSWD